MTLPARNPSRATRDRVAAREHLVVIGNGMVGHRFVERARDGARFAVTVLGEEPRPAYDRVNLSKFFEGQGAEDLALATAADYEQAGVTLLLGERAVAVDRARRRVVTDRGRELAY